MQKFIFLLRRPIFYMSIYLLLSFLMPHQAWAKLVHYDLVATRGKVNMSGQKEVDWALMLNGSIPAPTLEFTEGDDAEIVVKNEIPGEEISTHWHGILLSPEMDGVPYVTTPPILSGESRTFKFKVRQHGTYWYHSHTAVQEQMGLYGAIVIHPKNETVKADRDVVVVLSDWSDEYAYNILKNLKKDGDYYQWKKKTIRSVVGAIKAKSIGNYLYNDYTRMGGMDLSDVGYDAFLINGKRDLQLTEAHPGETVRLRIINASASTYFYVALGQTPMRVISVDGIDIKPIQANDILLGMAETYDVLFKVPAHKNYELLVTAQDGTGTTSGWVGMGEKVFAPQKPKPDLYLRMDMNMDHGSMSMDHGSMTMDHQAPSNKASLNSQSDIVQQQQHPAKASAPTPDAGPDAGHSKMNMNHGDMKNMDHGNMPMEHTMPPGKKVSEPEAHTGHEAQASNPDIIIPTLTVDGIQAIAPTTLPKVAKVHEVKLSLDGDMRRYIWYINGKATYEDRNINIKEGEIIRFTLVNNSMMHHPFHLHGHFFRVLNQFGEYSPLKHTVDVPPHGTRVMEFYANEPGEWMFHCHNLYHMKTGMARIVKYVSFKPSQEIQKWQNLDPHLHDHFYFHNQLEVSSNHLQGRFKASQTWNEFEARFESRKDFGWKGEGDLFYRRWQNKYLNFMGGYTNLEGQSHGVVGVGYLLPFILESQLLINENGNLRLDLEKRIQWSSHIFTDIAWTGRQREKSEFEVSLMYGHNWNWSAGLMFTENSAGAGIEAQF